MLTRQPTIAGIASDVPHLTAVQTLICGIAALGFAFDLYELLVLAVVVRPALSALGGLQAGSTGFNRIHFSSALISITTAGKLVFFRF